MNLLKELILLSHLQRKLSLWNRASINQRFLKMRWKAVVVKILHQKTLGRQQKFAFSGTTGLNQHYHAALLNSTPYECFSLFLDNEILDFMVVQTNLYAQQQVESAKDVSKNSRLHSWTPTDRTEMKQFIGLLGYMGMVRMNSIRDYWSTNPIFKNDIAPNTMSRNRFEVLLRMWHFSDNAESAEGDRLHKVQPLVDKFLNKFQSAFTPGEVFCIDETLVPFQGRLVMKQYIPNKAHKYGIKIFKLCSDRGYTWNLKIYSG